MTTDPALVAASSSAASALISASNPALAATTSAAPASVAVGGLPLVTGAPAVDETSRYATVGVAVHVDSGNEIVGYTASNTVTATIRKLGDAGDVVDAAVGAGANQVYGPNLLTSDQDAAYRNALKEAVAQARTKAETLATASNSTLGKITAIVESGGAAPMPMALGAAKDSSVPIEPGTQKIEATVSVTFALG